MWFSKRKWDDMGRRVQRCEEGLKKHQEEMNQRILTMARRILREPEKLSEELDGIEDIKQFVNKVIHS